MVEHKRFNSLWAVFGVLCVVIVGLVVGIVVSGTIGKEQAEEEVSLVVQAQGEVQELELIDIGEAIEIYQKYIDKADDAERAELYNARTNFLYDNDSDKEYGAQAIGDQIKADEILQTVESAVAVMNVASYYGNKKVYDEYNEISMERERANGADMDMEVRG